MSLFTISLSSVLQLIQEAKRGLREYSMHLSLPPNRFWSFLAAVDYNAPPLSLCYLVKGNNFLAVFHYGAFYLVIERERDKVTAYVTDSVTDLLKDIKVLGCWEGDNPSTLRCLFI